MEMAGDGALNNFPKVFNLIRHYINSSVLLYIGIPVDYLVF